MNHPNSQMPEAPGGCEKNDHTTRFYTVAQVAERYGVSERIVYQAIHTGDLHATRIGGWKISDEDLRAFDTKGGARKEPKAPDNRPLR